ncbi:ANTAR domain-containing protein [Amycolatopsis balhimycina]|uniref:ANTAR domain-containing protein n=1 Tax=Amycolatopsis balhimycina TaxID=208443 RepID=UPI00146E5010|nr:ANTAR domain-containing protein [Amycolatopsis balhimycina]
MSAATKGAERARARGETAGERVRELAARRAALAARARAGVDRAAAARAAEHAKAALVRAAGARESLRQSFLRSAEAHERAARALERRAPERGTAAGLTDRRHAAEHRAAAEADRRQAAECATPPQPSDAATGLRSARREVLSHRLDHAARHADPSMGYASAMAVTVTRILRGVDAVVITVRGGGLAQHELAATDRWGHQVEELQYTTGEGPSVTAFTTGEPVAVTDLTEHGEDWPGFVDAAAGYGLGAAFAFPLAASTATLGTLTLYRREPGTPSTSFADIRDLAELLAAALLADGELADRISSSLAYEDVNMAAGLLSVQQAISIEEAMARLRAMAFADGRPLTETAREVVTRHLNRHHDRPGE